MKSSRDSLLDRRGPFTTALVPDARRGCALRDRSLSNRLYPWGHSLSASRPHLGETTAVILEAPMILAASWFVCRWCVDRLDVRRTVSARSFVGLGSILVV